MNKKKVCIIISSFNEEDNVKNIYNNIKVDEEKYDYNICFIDDGSRDNTYNNLLEIKNIDKHIKIIKFIHNFGHEACMIAGVDENVESDYFIILDCDMQHPPKYIKDILSKLDLGHDAVLMKRIENKSESFIHNFFSDTYYKFINIIFKTKLYKGVSDFIAFDKSIALILKNKYRYKNRFMRFIVEKYSKNPAIIEYEAEKRYSGESKYSFIKYVKLAMNSIKAMNKINKNVDLVEEIYEIEKVI